MGPNTGTRVADKTKQDVDDFFDLLMTPPEEIEEDDLRDITPFEAISATKLYTTRRLLSLLTTSQDEKYLHKLESMQDYSKLLIADMFINTAADENVRAEIEAAMDRSERTLDSNLVKAASIYFSAIPSRQIKKQTDNLIEKLKLGFKAKYEEELLGNYHDKYNENREVKKRIRGRSRFPRVLGTIVIAGVLAIALFNGLVFYQDQLADQRQYMEHVRVEYSVEIPDHLDQTLGEYLEKELDVNVPGLVDQGLEEFVDEIGIDPVSFDYKTVLEEILK